MPRTSTHIKSETVHRNSKDGCGWSQRGNSTENLTLTVDRVEQLTEEWALENS